MRSFFDSLFELIDTSRGNSNKKLLSQKSNNSTTFYKDKVVSLFPGASLRLLPAFSPALISATFYMYFRPYLSAQSLFTPSLSVCDSLINSEHKRSPRAFQRREPPFGSDNMSAWERDDSSGDGTEKVNKNASSNSRIHITTK